MNRSETSSELRSEWVETPWKTVLLVCSIFLAAIAAYHNTFSVPLLFDDKTSITNNPTILRLGTALRPAAHRTVSGRPVLNLSFALNYALGGTKVEGYHLANLAIHILAGLTLFGVVRRTLKLRLEKAASLVAFFIALGWTLHPLQTQSVTYLAQRAESLMGLLYLLTLYCFIRGVDGTRRRETAWFSLSVAFCLLGMATKEAMVSAPLIVLLYDRTFVAGSFREAFKNRGKIFAALAGTWLVLALLIFSVPDRGGSETSIGAAWWRYLLTQLPAIGHYVQLCFWPRPLVFDYGSFIIHFSFRILLEALLALGLAVATLWALANRPVLGFLGASFFAILAPSSSFVPVAGETMADYRMYLPSACVIALLVYLIFRWFGRASVPICLALALGLGAATEMRNRVYSSELALWADTVAVRPQNPRAHNNLGNCLLAIPGRLDEAIAQFEAALRINPSYAEAHNNLGIALGRSPGRSADSIAQFEAALEIDPRFSEAHYNLGTILMVTPGRLPDSIAQLEAALRLNPDYADAHTRLGTILVNVPGRLPEAIAQFEEVSRIQPNDATAHYNLGAGLTLVPGRLSDAVTELRIALRIDPNYAEAHNNLGNVLARIPGRLPDAIAELEAALRIDPNYAEAHNNLGICFARIPGRLPDAVAEFQAAIKARPDYARAHFNLGYVFLKMGAHDGEASSQLEAARRLDPKLEPFVTILHPTP